MKLLKLVKFHLKLIGCLEWHISVPYCGFLITLILRLCVIFSLIFSIVTTFWFFFFEAKELKELSESFVYGASHSVWLIWYLLFLWKCKTFEGFLQNLETKISIHVLNQNFNNNYHCNSIHTFRQGESVHIL